MGPVQQQATLQPVITGDNRLQLSVEQFQLWWSTLQDYAIAVATSHAVQQSGRCTAIQFKQSRPHLQTNIMCQQQRHSSDGVARAKDVRSKWRAFADNALGLVHFGGHYYHATHQVQNGRVPHGTRTVTTPLEIIDILLSHTATLTVWSYSLQQHGANFYSASSNL